MRPSLTGPEVDSFYHLSEVTMDHRRCRGTACFAAQRQDPNGWRLALEQWPPVYCLGKCYAAPSSTETAEEPIVEAHCSNPIVLDGVAGFGQRDLSGYRANGGYVALESALKGSPEAVVAAVEASQLRGRGGAGYSAGRKWRAVWSHASPVKSVVANADEGDHGSYIDRFILERTPHRLLEALELAGFAVGATQGTIYLRKEYPAAEAAVRRALDEAREAGILGKDIAGSSFEFEIDVVIGQGSYVCGEETSLLNSIEHRRPEVRARPPFPTEEGLYGRPTLVNNVETLASVPWIVREGGAAYAQRGFSKSRGTKAVSLNSLFLRPGLYEVEFGVSLNRILLELGGGLKTGPIKAAIIGGPLAGLIHPREFGTPFGFEELHAIGASLGHGGIVGFDDSTAFDRLLAHVFAFGAIESCGKCTPCRLGTRRVQVLFDKAAGGEPLDSEESSELRALLDALARTSLCGHGSGLAVIARSAFEKFGQELARC